MVPQAGVNILGTRPEDIDRAEDRDKFSAMLDSIGVDQVMRLVFMLPSAQRSKIPTLRFFVVAVFFLFLFCVIDVINVSSYCVPECKNACFFCCFVFTWCVSRTRASFVLISLVD